MKIAIIGYSGSGKSTLAKKAGERIAVPVLHLDRIGWTSGWVLNDLEKAEQSLKDFLDDNESWIIEGNWGQFDKGRRYDEADKIVFMNFPRRICLPRAIKRYATYRGRSREDIAEGCPETFDLDFLIWILWSGRNKYRKKMYRTVASNHPKKFVELKNPEEVNRFLATLKVDGQ